MAIDKLQAHWGFTRMPFGRDLAPSMLFTARAHAEAVARIRWLVNEGPLGVLTGEVGAGKTIAVRAAMSALDHRHAVIYLGNPAVGVRGYYRQIVSTLGGIPPYQSSALIAAAVDRLQTEGVERGRRVVVICDEAHLLATGQLEELRFLLSAEMDSRALFSCLLVGQPTLRRRLKLGAYAALDQRVALRYHLDGMDATETVAYVQHHLALAGRKDPLFSDDALALIHQTSRGLPRAVNNLAIQALIAAFADGKAIVDQSSATAAVTELASD
ncbi:MAG TPA: AAA family ATPase [Candidatus Dormibacteraeota bacterium]|nr:AAA family ATPase [Candidatus Dormibacteraeota bacterium]